MSLGETLDSIRVEHEDRAVILARDAGEQHVECEMCRALDRIQKAYEEMIQGLKVLEDTPPLSADFSFDDAIPANDGDDYDTVLSRDSEYLKDRQNGETQI